MEFEKPSLRVLPGRLLQPSESRSSYLRLLVLDLALHCLRPFFECRRWPLQYGQFGSLPLSIAFLAMYDPQNVHATPLLRGLRFQRRTAQTSRKNGFCQGLYGLRTLNPLFRI